MLSFKNSYCVTINFKITLKLETLAFEELNLCVLLASTATGTQTANHAVYSLVTYAPDNETYLNIESIMIFKLCNIIFLDSTVYLRMRQLVILI